MWEVILRANSKQPDQLRYNLQYSKLQYDFADNLTQD